MQNRLRHLESLVKGAMEGKTPSNGDGQFGGPSPVPNMGTETFESNGNAVVPEAPEVSSGKVLTDDNELTYVGATHWAAILEDVRLLWPPSIHLQELQLTNPRSKK